MELPGIIESYLLETYGHNLLDWYRRWAKCFLDAGIPDNDVVEIMKKNPVPLGIVRRYGFSTGLVPETVAHNIINHLHDPVEYDSLSRPRIRVTKKMIANFRVDLEKEMRRIWSPNDYSLEDNIKEFCYQSTDEEIVSFIQRDVSAESWARNIYDYL
jgi:hypothetical protein